MTTLVVLTRPEGDNSRLESTLAAQGYDTYIQPLLRIASLPESELPDPPDLTGDDLCIFISANAARMGLPTLMGGMVENGIVSFAVGPRTANVLEVEGLPVIVPEQMDSEGLLALPELRNVQGRRVVIVKGEGGREVLARELEAKGALVEEYICYRRESALVDSDTFCASLLDYEKIIFQANSGQTLAALTTVLEQCEGASFLQQCVIVPSQRVADDARNLGWQRVAVADNASDDAFLAALTKELPMDDDTGATQPLSSDSASSDSASPHSVSPHSSSKALKKQAKIEPELTGPRKGLGAFFVFIFVLLLTSGAAAAAYFILLPAWQAQTAVVTSLQQQVESLGVADATLQSRLGGQMDTQAAQFEQRAAELLKNQASQQALELARSQADFDEEQRRLNGRLDRLDIRIARLTATDRRAWLANEAAFLVRLAAQRLLVSRDIEAAEALLGNADALLSEADDPRFESARGALAADLSALRAAPRVDVVGLYARFSALTGQASALTVVVAPPVSTAESSSSQGWLARAESGWKVALAKLSDYLVVRSREAEMSRMMTPDWEALARQNLRLLLEQGQIAALSHNQALYDTALERAAAFVSEFMPNDPNRVAAMLEEIQALRALNIAPALPNLLTSRAAIADALRSIDSDKTLPSVTDAELVEPTIPSVDSSSAVIESND